LLHSVVIVVVIRCRLSSHDVTVGLQTGVLTARVNVRERSQLTVQ